MPEFFQETMRLFTGQPITQKAGHPQILQTQILITLYPTVQQYMRQHIHWEFSAQQIPERTGSWLTTDLPIKKLTGYSPQAAAFMQQLIQVCFGLQTMAMTGLKLGLTIRE